MENEQTRPRPRPTRTPRRRRFPEFRIDSLQRKEKWGNDGEKKTGRHFRWTDFSSYKKSPHFGSSRSFWCYTQPLARSLDRPIDQHSKQAGNESAIQPNTHKPHCYDAASLFLSSLELSNCQVFAADGSPLRPRHADRLLPFPPRETLQAAASRLHDTNHRDNTLRKK